MGFNTPWWQWAGLTCGIEMLLTGGWYGLLRPVVWLHRRQLTKQRERDTELREEARQLTLERERQRRVDEERRKQHEAQVRHHRAEQARREIEAEAQTKKSRTEVGGVTLAQYQHEIEQLAMAIGAHFAAEQRGFRLPLAQKYHDGLQVGLLPNIDGFAAKYSALPAEVFTFKDRLQDARWYAKELCEQVTHFFMMAHIETVFEMHQNQLHPAVTTLDVLRMRNWSVDPSLSHREFMERAVELLERIQQALGQARTSQGIQPHPPAGPELVKLEAELEAERDAEIEVVRKNGWDKLQQDAEIEFILLAYAIKMAQIRGSAP